MTKQELIAELEACGNTQVLWEKSIDIDWTRFVNILSRAKSESPTPEQEPLAVLADRKGYNTVESKTLSDGTWSLYINGTRIMFKDFFGVSLCEAESKARVYLMGLPDVK